MNIAIICHQNKLNLMVQFCAAYCGILSRHEIYAAANTGRIVSELTGLPINFLLSHQHGGIEQLGQRIVYNEIDMVIFLNQPDDDILSDAQKSICALCDKYMIPIATNIGAAELLIHGLSRGDLDWRKQLKSEASAVAV